MSLKILKYLETEQHVSEQHRAREEMERKTKKYFQPNENENTAFQNALALRMQCSGMEGAAGHETSASIWKQKKSSKLNPKC